MTKGRLIYILNGNGDCVHSRIFSGEMGMEQTSGMLAIEKLKHCSNRKDFNGIAWDFIKLYNYVDLYTEEEWLDCGYLEQSNIMEDDFSYRENTHGRDYFDRWFADQLYVLNVCGEDVTTKVAVGKYHDGGYDSEDFTFKTGTLTVLDFGKVAKTVEAGK